MPAADASEQLPDRGEHAVISGSAEIRLCQEGDALRAAEDPGRAFPSLFAHDDAPR